MSHHFSGDKNASRRIPVGFCYDDGAKSFHINGSRFFVNHDIIYSRLYRRTCMKNTENYITLCKSSTKLSTCISKSVHWTCQIFQNQYIQISQKINKMNRSAHQHKFWFYPTRCKSLPGYQRSVSAIAAECYVTRMMKTFTLILYPLNLHL